MVSNWLGFDLKRIKAYKTLEKLVERFDDHIDT